MKKIATLVTLFIVSITAFTQSSMPAPTLTKADLLQKAKNQSTAGWILLGGGAGLTIAGAIEITSTLGDIFDDNSDSYNRKTNTGTVLMIAGLAAMGGSIPLLISGHRNRKKAMTLVITNESIQMLQKGGWSYQRYPALSLKINFGGRR
jgi:hypothetical protein